MGAGLRAFSFSSSIAAAASSAAARTGLDASCRLLGVAALPAGRLRLANDDRLGQGLDEELGLDFDRGLGDDVGNRLRLDDGLRFDDDRVEDRFGLDNDFGLGCRFRFDDGFRFRDDRVEDWFGLRDRFGLDDPVRARRLRACARTCRCPVPARKTLRAR